MLRDVLSALSENKELVGIIVTSAVLGIGGIKTARKNNTDHGADQKLMSQVLDNQIRMHSENRADIHELKDDIEAITTWMTRHQALHDAYAEQRRQQRRNPRP